MYVDLGVGFWLVSNLLLLWGQLLEKENMRGVARPGLTGKLSMLCSSTRTATFCLRRHTLNLASRVNY